MERLEGLVESLIVRIEALERGNATDSYRPIDRGASMRAHMRRLRQSTEI